MPTHMTLGNMRANGVRTLAAWCLGRALTSACIIAKSADKRGMEGVYQHCAEKNLHRYLAEFEFRYNTRKITDSERAMLAVRGGEGKRLMYRQPH